MDAIQQNYPILKEFEKRYQIPVFINNDANCFIIINRS
jgi:predicted NBD/HSP70 family sugar kinase